MGISITNSYIDTTASISVEISDAPDVDVDYSGRIMQPDHLTVKYRYLQHDNAGWTTHEWSVSFVEIVGHRLLKPGKDGERRVGSSTGKTTWYFANHIQRRPMPEWLVELVEALRPSGDLHLPAVKQ